MRHGGSSPTLQELHRWDRRNVGPSGHSISIWKKLIVRLVVTVKVEQWGGAALRQNWSVASTFLGEHCSVGINDDRATWRAGWRRTPSGLSLDLVTSCSPAFERH